jgi:hypothetical protein
VISDSRIAALAALGSILMLSTTTARAQNHDGDSQPTEAPLVFVADPKSGIEGGIITAASLARTVGHYDDYARRLVMLDEERPLDVGLAIAGRALKLVFVDVPLSSLEQLVVHEVFGHGSRGREAGKWPTFEFKLMPPYRWLWTHDDAPFTGLTVGAATGRLERDQPMVFGGIEADYFAAWWIEARVVQQSGWVNYRDLLSYGFFKLAYASSLASDLSSLPSKPTEIDDADSYVSQLQERFNRWRPQGRVALAGSLRRAYLWNFADPTLWLCAYHGLSTYLIKGERYARLPLLEVNGLLLFPGTRFNLTPFGAEHYLDVFGRYDGAVANLYGRSGSSGLARYWGFGGRAFGVRVGGGVALGGEVDVWYQPEILFSERYVFHRPSLFGFNAGATVDWKVYKQLGLTGRIAYKTKGCLMGQPVAQGLHGYAGVTIATDSEGASFE